MVRVTVRIWHPIKIHNPSYQSVQPAALASSDAQQLRHTVIQQLGNKREVYCHQTLIHLAFRQFEDMRRDFVLRIHRRKIRPPATPLRSVAPRELVHLAWKAILIGRSTERYVPRRPIRMSR